MSEGPSLDTEYRSGQEVPASGIYTSFDSEDQECGEVTCVLGEPFPPSENGGYFKLKDAANVDEGSLEIPTEHEE